MTTTEKRWTEKQKRISTDYIADSVCHFGRNYGVLHIRDVAEAEGCCATTSMWKVELELEFNFLSDSSFLSRLVRQVISVPFVVKINTAVAPRQLFCLMKLDLTGFY